MLRQAAEHKGAAFVEIFQNCNIYNDGAFDVVRDEPLNRIELKHGEPIRFGEEGSRGVRLRTDGSVEVVDVAEAGEDSVLVHDAAHPEPSIAFALSRLTIGTAGAAPVGVFRKIERSVYDTLMAEQIADAKAKKGEGDLDALLHTGDTWKIG